jgi:hypothetical protein
VNETALWAVTNLTQNPDARRKMADVGLRATVTQLFIRHNSDSQVKAMQAIRNFLVDGSFFRPRLRQGWLTGLLACR